MHLTFLIDNKEADGTEAGIPKFGIVEGYVQEGINQVSLIELLVISDEELEEDTCEELLGKQVQLAIGDELDGELFWARFDGNIYEMHIPNEYRVDAGSYPYRMVIRPPVWKLNFQSNSRSFSDTSRIEAIDAILKENGITKDALYECQYFAAAKSYPRIGQILQNESTDLNFLQQLMQEAGINYYYYSEKEGDQPEILRLVDDNAYFKASYKAEIPWNSTEGMVAAERCINSFETRMHTTPSKVDTAADLGDGRVNAYKGEGEIDGGKGGTIKVFNREGQTEDAAKQHASVLADSYATNKVTYQGRSNVVAIRPGERVTVTGDSIAKDKEVLVTSVRHSFRQSVTVAMGYKFDPEYRNSFSAVRKDSQIRPANVRLRSVGAAVDSRRDKSRNTLFETIEYKIDKNLELDLQLDLNEGAEYNPQEAVQNLVDELMRIREMSGIWVGEVVEDAAVTEGNELICKVTNEQFPLNDDGTGGLTAKVSLGWLTEQGWLSLLPRKGNFVYFMFVQGAGGYNEPVVIGYRPTSAVQTLDPSKTTETKKLSVGTAPKLKEAAQEVVKQEVYEPLNRQRQTLIGEKGVAEVAVIDGGDDAVAIHANKGIHIVGDEEIHTDTKAHCQNAEVLHQQFVNVNRGVKENQKESIGANHEFTVMKDQTIEIQGKKAEHVVGEIKINNDGKENIIIANGEKTGLTMSEGKKANLGADDKNFLMISTDDKLVTATADTEVNLTTKKSKGVFNADGVVIETKGTTVTITSGGAVKIEGKGDITVSGVNVKVEGKANVDVDGKAMVNIKGGMVNIN